MKTQRSAVSIPLRATLLGLAFLTLSTGCTRYEDVEQALGTGTILELPVDQADALQAVRSAIRGERLELEEEDTHRGILWVHKGLNWWDWGERMVIRVESTGSGYTEVELVTRASLRFLEPGEDTAQRLKARITEQFESTP